VTIIGACSVVSGSVTSKNNVEVYGEVVVSYGVAVESEKDVTVGVGGRISGGITARDVFISGVVVGDINASGHVGLSKHAVVSGNIRCGKMTAECGAVFNGSVCSSEVGTEVDTEADGDGGAEVDTDGDGGSDGGCC